MIPTLPTTIKGIATALLAQYPTLTKAMPRAVDLLHGARIRFSHHDTQGQPVYLVTASDGVSVYVVEACACTCPARKICYHRVARAILVTRSANLTAVAFDEAVASDEQDPSAPQESAPPAEYVGPAYTPPSGDGVKRVQSSGRMIKGLTIRASMDALGRRLVEVFTSRPVGAKLH